MGEGIKTVIYPVSDLAKAKAMFGAVLGAAPVMDEPGRRPPADPAGRLSRAPRLPHRPHLPASQARTGAGAPHITATMGHRCRQDGNDVPIHVVPGGSPPPPDGAGGACGTGGDDGDARESTRGHPPRDHDHFQLGSIA
jgi:catechol 2,3-dioxygenase-like lactoylglutathione lyase family enzyme